MATANERTRVHTRSGIGEARLARIAGIDIAADWSLLIIFSIVAVQLGLFGYMALYHLVFWKRP